MIPELSAAYQALLKSNPLIAQALPIGMAGVFGYVFRSLPLQLWYAISRQCTTSITLLSTGAGSTDMQYFSFQRWFREQGFLKWSRSLAVESTWAWRLANGGGGTEDDANGQISAGDGRHFFVWAGRLCWLTKHRIESGGTTNEITHVITVTMLGRSHDKLKAAVDAFRWRPSKGTSCLYFPTNNGEWQTLREISPRKIETVILNEGIKETLLDRIEWFLGNKSWYVDRGLPYRLVIVLYGPPGTGKSSLLRALACHFKRNLCPVNLSSYSDDGLSAIIRTVPSDSLVVMEDFDSCQAVLRPEYRKESSLPDGVNLSKTGILQALDGIDTLDGQIIIMTTNYLEKIEPSIIREERVNEMFYLGPLENKAIHAYIHQMFPGEHILTKVLFQPVVGAVLQKLYKQHHQSYRDFISAVSVANPDLESEPTKETV